MEIIRLIIGYAFLLAGLVFFIIEVAGVFKLDYALNRMHSAAIGDSFALALSMLGLVIINGINFVSFKLLLVLVFMWFSSPAASHLIAKLEVETTDKKDKFREVEK